MYIPDRKPRDYDTNQVGATETLAHGFYTMSKVMEAEGVKGKGIIVTGPPSCYVARMVF